MAERKIRCLNNQVKAIRGKKLVGKPKQWSENDSNDGIFPFDDEAEVEVRGRRSSCAAVEAAWVSPMSKQRSRSQPPPKVCSRASTSQGLKSPFEVDRERSFGSRQLAISMESHEGINRYSTNNSMRFVSGDHFLSLNNTHSEGEPSADYLQGAVWLGRNILMITEDMVEQMDSFRSKYLRELSNLSRSDSGVSSGTTHRISLLAASGITEAMSVAYQSRAKSRKMLEVTNIPLFF
jgi:hypothetical protein